MEHQEVIARLKGLRQEIEQEGEVGIAELETTFALALADVCGALGMGRQEYEQVLGQEAASSVEDVCETRVWLVGARGAVAALMQE